MEWDVPRRSGQNGIQLGSLRHPLLGDQFDPISKRVGHMAAAHSGDAGIVLHGYRSRSQARGQSLIIAAAQRRMSFFGRAKVFLYAEMDQDIPACEPASPALGQFWRLRYLDHSEQIDKEPARRVLAVERHGQLDVVNGRERGHGHEFILRPLRGELVVRRWSFVVRGSAESIYPPQTRQAASLRLKKSFVPRGATGRQSGTDNPAPTTNDERPTTGPRDLRLLKLRLTPWIPLTSVTSRSSRTSTTASPPWPTACSNSPAR